MANYSYSAMDKSGKTKKGKLEARNLEIANQMLKDSGLYPLDVTEEGALTKDLVIGNPVGTKDLTIFCQQFEAVLTAGISVLEALHLLREQTENKHFQKIIADLYASVEQGESLSSSMAKHPRAFPSILINMIEAGEVSGNLEVALRRMASHFEKEFKLQQDVKKATTYPIVVAIISVAVVIVLLVVVIPTFVGMFAEMGMELPLTTRMLLGMSDFVIQQWYVLVAIVGLVSAFFIYYAKSEVGKMTLSGIKLKAPVFGQLNTKIVASRFARTLSTLLASGLPLLDALEVVSKVVDNHKVMNGIVDARDQVSKGMPLSKPISEMGVFPPMINHMVRIGEDTGQLEPILDKVADFYDTEVETAVSQLTTMLEPLIIVVLALVVGFVVISIIQPMFQMYGGLNNL